MANNADSTERAGAPPTSGLTDLLEHLAGGSDVWGSDECACDECIQLRRVARVRAIELSVRVGDWS